MQTLSRHEARVLGVLIEKAQTTPAQYPMTLNALTVGANQKNNRFPVTNLTEDQVLEALDGLRTKGLVREALLSGSRVAKYRHQTREVLGIETPALVILAELMLRGPQSLGDIRQNAGRMHPLDSLDSVKAVLDQLASRPEPLVREYPPPPGSRARLYRQLLAPDAHREPSSDAAEQPDESSGDHRSTSATAATAALESRVRDLEAQVALLNQAVRRLASDLGAAAPL